MSYGRGRDLSPLDWVSQPYRQPLASRAGRAAAAGAGRLAVAGGKRAKARWRPGMPLLVALFVHVLAVLLRAAVLGIRKLGGSSHTWTVDLVLATVAVAVLLPMWWVALGWPVPRKHRRRRAWQSSRLAHLVVGSALLLMYLPVSVWWLPPWRTLGAPWLPVVAVTAVVSLAVWAWGYWGFYRTHEVEEEPEPAEVYGPAELWAEEIGAAGGLLPGSTLAAVRDIEVSA
jgi:hypothetical protein